MNWCVILDRQSGLIGIVMLLMSLSIVFFVDAGRSSCIVVGCMNVEWRMCMNRRGEMCEVTVDTAVCRTRSWAWARSTMQLPVVLT